MGRPDYILGQFGKRVGGSKVNLFVIKITASGIGHLVCTRLVAALFVHGLALTSQYHNTSMPYFQLVVITASLFAALSQTDETTNY